MITAIIAKWVLAVLLIVGGLIWIVVNVWADAWGNPDPGPLGGWGPVIAGLVAIGIGVLFAVF